MKNVEHWKRVLLAVAMLIRDRLDDVTVVTPVVTDIFDGGMR